MSGQVTIGHWRAGGRWAGGGDRYGDVHDPATGRVTGQVALASGEEVAAVVADAVGAGREWAATSLARRTAVLFAFREVLSRRSEEVAATITTSGVAIGRKISRFEADRPRKECRTSAKAIRVPSTVASTVAVALTARLSWSDSHSPSGSQIVVQLRHVKASSSPVAERPVGWLNDSAKM